MDESKATGPKDGVGTEADTTENHLPQDGALYKTLFAEHPECLVLVVEGKIALASDRCLELTGYTAEEVVGMSPTDLVIPEDRTRSTMRIDDLLSEGREHPSVYTLLRKNGDTVPIVANARRILYDGKAALISVLRDITERKEAEEELRQSEARFSAAFHDNPVPVAISRVADGKLIDVNDAFLSLTGFRRSETIGRTTNELGLLVDSAPFIEAAEAVRERGTIPDFPGQLKKKTGEVIDVLATITQIELEGEPCLLTTIVDVTERKRLEDELQKMRGDLESKVEREMDRGNSYKLTFREFTVLHLIATGKADKEIAVELGISNYTVHRHVSHILAKMDSPSRTEAGTRALREGLLD